MSLSHWTNVTSSFVVNTTVTHSARGSSPGCAQGGAFSSSEIRQDVAVADGYRVGAVALLTFARLTALASDSGTVILEARDASGVLTSVSTGALAHTTLNVWNRAKLALAIPGGTTTLRVRLLATRTLGSGNSGACFDDFDLRVHKALDAATVVDLEFSRPSIQAMPATWQGFHLAWPTLPIPTVWGGSVLSPLAIGEQTLAGPIAAWSDAPTVHAPGSLVGYFTIVPNRLRPGETLPTLLTSTPAYRFVRAIAASAIDIQIDGVDLTSGDEQGGFNASQAFTVAVPFRVREDAFASACGLVGRRGSAGVGWGLGIDGSGRVRATLQGASGTKTATRTVTTADKALHWAVLVYDPDADTLTVYDERGGTGVSTASGMGEFFEADVPMRIGRDAPASATGDVDIGRVYMFYEVLTSAQVASLCQHGLDPSGLATYSTNRALWVEGAPAYTGLIEDETGATLVRFASDQTPIGYSIALADDGGTAYGLAVAGANTNLVPTADLAASGTWTPEGSVTLAQGIVDPTGMPRGVRVTGNATNGLTCVGLAVGASTATVGVVVYARAVTGAPSLQVEVLNASDVQKGTTTATLSTRWTRVQLSGVAWDGSSSTMRLRLRSAGAFELAHVAWAGVGDPPLAIQDPGLAVNDSHAARVVTLSTQLTHEGEIYVEAVCSLGSPTVGATLASVDNGSSANNKRAATIAAGPDARASLWNNSGTATHVDTPSPLAWYTVQGVRARWNRLSIPDANGEHLAVRTADDNNNAASSLFTVGGALAAIRIGGGDPTGSTSPHALVRRVRVSAREPKLR